MPKSPNILIALLILTLLSAALSQSFAAELECAGEPLSARGQGFSPSPEKSAENAKAEWLKKALKVYSDATVDSAKNPDMLCVNQGLYSNCKLTAVPCGKTKAPPEKKAE